MKNASHIVGWPMPDGRLLLRDLTEHATQREFVYPHKWRVGDLVMWENRCTLHDAAPQPLDKHVVAPGAFAVHADRNAIVGERADRAYLTALPLRMAASPRQRLHLSTRKICSDNRDHFITTLRL